MSDYFTKIVPADPFYRVSDEVKIKVTDYLAAAVKADMIEANIYDAPAFIDCGDNLEKINCPVCGDEISIDWWGEAMEKAYMSEFHDLEIKTPCCNSLTSLNDLKYYFPCAFACSEFVVMNPEKDIDKSIISEVEKILKLSVCIIKAHM